MEHYQLSGSGSVYPPIRRPENSPWIVVDEIGFCWAEPKEWRDKGLAKAFSIHLDRDDLFHEFLTEDEWRPLPNARKMAMAYNAPFTKTMRLRIRRATDSHSVSQIMDPFYLAQDALRLARMIRENDQTDHIAGVLEYYPNGWIWKAGARWLRLNQADGVM